MGVKKSWGDFHSELPKAQVFILYPRTVICNSCDQDLVSCHILDDGGNIDEQKGWGFQAHFSEKNLDDITKRK